MADPGAAAEGVRAALDLTVSATTAGFSVSLRIDNVILAGIATVGALTLGAYYLTNRKSVERAIRNGLERRTEDDLVDPEVRNIEGGSILVELHCKTEHSFIQFVEDFKAEKVKHRLEKEFKRIGFSSELKVTIENADEMSKNVEMVRLSEKGRRTKKVEGGDKELNRESAKEHNKSARIRAVEDEIKKIHDYLGISASGEKPNKRIIFADFVSRAGASWILQKTGISITFSQDAVQAPVMVTSSLWGPGTVSPPLEDNETLVSNIIELACDESVDIDFSKVTVALSHSATDLRDFEIVLKERIDSENNVWKDLETSYPVDPLGENCTSGSELRFAKAKITSFSIYAVISRLKSYKVLVPEESPEFTYTMTEYPNVSVTVPSRSSLAMKDFAFTLKVQQAPNSYFEERGVFVSPILHISCLVVVELKEPALIRMPITLDQQQDESLNLPSSHISVFYRSTGKESQEWVEITSELKAPPKLEIGVVSFQVNHFSEYWVVVDSRNKKKRRPWKSFPSPNVPQHVGFLACLCDTRRHENYELILCCFPNHLRVEVKNDIASSYDVVSLGEGTSLLPLNKGDWASFHLPEMYTLLEKENNLVRFVGNSLYKKSVRVQVESTDRSHSMKFVKRTTGQKKKETQLCNVSIVPVSKRQVPPHKPITSEGEPGNIVMHPDLCRTVTIEQLLPLKEEIGNCWMDLGFALDLSEARVSNIRDDCNSNKERGYAVLMAWMEQHGKNATMGRLAVVLDGIGRKDIVDSLFEQLDETENNSLQKENSGELREKSSSSNLKEECTPDIEEDAEEDAVMKRPQEVIEKLNSDLENEKELTKKLQQRVEKLQKHEEILEKKVDDANQLFQKMENIVQKKDEEIKKLTFKKQQKEKQIEAAGMLVDESEKPHEQRKKEEDRINKLISDAKNDPELALKLQQYIEESGILEDEYKRLKEDEIQHLRSELVRAKQEEQTRSGELDIYVGQCDKLQNEVEKKEEIIKKLTSELKKKTNQVEQLKQMIDESKIVEEDLNRKLALP